MVNIKMEMIVAQEGSSIHLLALNSMDKLSHISLIMLGFVNATYI